MKPTKLFFLLLFIVTKSFSQGFPWERPLKMAWSTDGITFNTPTLFQDSSGVPSIVKWKGDTLIAIFQWFRVPNPSASWDRVAVKFSYDNGINWTEPTPIVVDGFPSTYQRPFDPTLVVLNSDSVRIYFSSSDGFPVGGLDSTVNTYSASSIDGVNYTFEANARVDEDTNRVIDPAVIFFNNACHYISPIGSPQQGAYHYISPNGINFMKVQNIPSDNNHNWTGNYVINDSNDLRFYGAGANGIWYNSTPNGGMWNGYVNTNIQGGDPSVVKVSATNYLIVFVGSSYTTGIDVEAVDENSITVYPNPAGNWINVKSGSELISSNYIVIDRNGKIVLSGKILSGNFEIDLGTLPDGIYLVRVGEKREQIFEVLKH